MKIIGNPVTSILATNTVNLIHLKAQKELEFILLLKYFVEVGA